MVQIICLFQYQMQLAEAGNVYEFAWYRWYSNLFFLVLVLRLLYMLGTEHSSLHIFLNIWCQILFLEDLHDASLYNF